MLTNMAGLRRARAAVEDAAGKVTASAQSAARSVGAAIGIAVVALVVALFAVVLCVRRAHA